MVAQKQKERDDLAASFPTSLQERYQRLRQGKKGAVVVPLKNQQCAGCHMKVSPNLVNEVKITGFDYNMSPRQVADAVRDGQVQLYDKVVSIELNGQKPKINLAEVPNVTEPHAYY